MGSENSKSDNEQIPERNRTKKNVTQRYYTEDEIQRALANQKRMFEAKQLETQRSSSIYPNLHSQNLHTINSPSTSNAIHYSVTPSAPPENDMPYPRRTTTTGEGYQQTNDVLMPRFLQGTAKPACASPSRITPASAGPSRVTPASAGPSRVTPASTGPSRVTPASTGLSRVTPSSAGSLYVTSPSAKPLYNTTPSAKPSHVTPPSAEPSHVTPLSTASSRDRPPTPRPSDVTSTSSGPSRVKLSSSNLSRVQPSSTGPSRVTPSFPGLSYVTPSSPGPSHVTSPSTASWRDRPPTPRPSHVTSTSSGPSRVRLSSSKPSRVQPSSTGPSHVTPSFPGLSHVTPSSPGPSHVTPPSTASWRDRPPTPRPSHVTSTSSEPTLVRLSSSKPSRVQPSSTRPPCVTPSSPGPSHVTPPSPGPFHVTPPSPGPSDVIPSFAGSLHVTTSSVGSLHVTSSTTEPSCVTATTTGLSHAAPAYKRNQKWNQGRPSRSRSRSWIPSPPSAGPSQAKPARNRNQNRNQGPQSRSKSWNKRGLSQIVNCVTCKGHLSVHIYQCSNGHSSCEGCKLTGARCGQCTSLITNMRNITLESTLADVTITEEQRVKCSNANDGCCLHFKRSELLDHLKECPFNIIPCPIVELSEDCNWKGTIKQLAHHFNEAHPNNCGGDVNKEMHILLLQLDYKVMYLVNIGCHQFLVHIQLNTSLNNICMVTQLLGTSFSASKWTYEWHVYNKREPRRKFEYVDVCKSNATPLSDIINNNNCATINIDHAKTFLDSGKLTFKFYIKKQFDRNDNDTTN